jgi:tetratricopeptide (TPR) repeat protein
MSLTRALRLAALLLVAGTPAFAADPVPVVRWRTDYVTARKEAEETKKPLLLVVGTTNCLYCVKMEAGTFTDPEVAKLVAERFIPVKLDAAAHPDFVRAMRITLYPTTVIAGPDAKVYAFLAGYLDAAGFQNNAGKALALIPAPAKDVAVVAKPVPAKPVEAPPTKPVEPTVTVPAVPDSALASLEAATAELDERTANAYLALAEQWIKQGKAKEAVACLEKAARASPNGKLAETALARLAAIVKE